MNSQEKWVRSCLGKKRYSTEGFARKLIARAKKERNVDLYHYLCNSCAGYHLTKIKDYKGRYQILRVC